MCDKDIECNKDYTPNMQLLSGSERYKQEEQRKQEQYESAKSLLSSVLVLLSATLVLLGQFTSKMAGLDHYIRVVMLKLLLMQIASIILASLIVYRRRNEFYSSSPKEVVIDIKQNYESFTKVQFQEMIVSNYQRKIEMLQKENKMRTCLLDWALGLMLGSIVLAFVIAFCIIEGGLGK